MTATVRHLVFIVDTTAAMGPHLPVLRDAYIDPLIRTVVEQSASKKEKLELAMVAFRDYPPAGNYVVRVSGFTRDPKQFGSWMDRLDFAAGGHQTVPLAEAFAAAFNLSYERMAKERYFVLVSNTAPYQQGIPARLYSIPGQPLGSTAADIATTFPKAQIALSVISPRQLNELAEIFQKATIPGWAESRGSKPDVPHMVLLRGLKIVSTLPTSSAPSASAPPAAATAPAVTMGGPAAVPVAPPAMVVPAAAGAPGVLGGTMPTAPAGIPNIPSAAAISAATAVGGNVPVGTMAPPTAVAPPMGSLGAAPVVANTSPSRLPVGVPAGAAMVGVTGGGGGVPGAMPVIGASGVPVGNPAGVPPMASAASAAAMRAAMTAKAAGMSPSLGPTGMQPAMKKAKTDVGPRPTAQQMGGMGGMNSPLGAPHPGGPFIPGNAPLGGGGGVPSTVGLNPGVNPGAPGGGGGSMASPTVDKRGLPPQVAMGNAGVGVAGVVGAPKPPPTVINLTNSAGGIPTPGGGPPPQQQTGGASPVGMPGALQTSTKPIWEGTLAWLQGQNVALLCSLAAYPRSKIELSAYGTKEWPSQLSVSGVCSSKDALQMHYKSALVLHFSPPPYNHFLNQLVSKSWAAVITLPSKTLFIIPHKETLLGLIHSKQHLNIRPFATGQQQGQVPQGQVPGQGNPQQQQQGQVVQGQNPQVVQGQNPQQAAQAQAAAAARRAAAAQSGVPGQPMGGFPGQMGGQLQGGMGMAMGQAGGAVMGGQSGHPGMVVGPPPGQGMAAPGVGHGGYSGGGGFPGQQSGQGGGGGMHSFQHMGAGTANLFGDW
ncbi:uncharacterized protein ACA1_215990 [Acanthamoeba castellanii str. Neff]|uniref:Mediator of RNA polymerase II transcription subunit 25 n=1 Tax=Acanthamoeba castellanii (strain ATCC 30010 / Neff) TaxID=1257118 RepID=L8GQG6_ACACF|nr:uncharacterized protein ACA1_215990 [Acanthamoeba castellanii str. Neff]ELR15117.1 hypothetical protein ACA1_215990 [Acanthamoeba castellanii str. Neff]